MDHLAWPFFEDRHRAFAERLDSFNLGEVDHHDVDNACRKLVAKLGDAGLLAASVVISELSLECTF